MSTFRWAYGTLTAAALTSTYDISSFPRQSDQNVGIDWEMGVDPADLYMESAEYVDSLSFGRGGFGGGTFTLVSAVMTPGMIDYMRSNLFQGMYSAPATVMTRDRASLNANWRTLNATALWPDVSKDAELGAGRYIRVKWVFVNAVMAGRGWSAGWSFGWG